MLTIGIIGAGSISKLHLGHYQKNKNCKLKSISDINIENAKIIADEFGIENCFTDYNDILKDSDIDAVCIFTPTFTHKQIFIEAIKNNKHIFCEKPPALNADEVRECIEASKGYDKCIMYGFVCRFKPEVQYMKDYIQSGRMGKIFCAEGARISRLTKSQGWFASKKHGGGILRDGAIHELDQMLYMMNYPKPKSVFAVSGNQNQDLPYKVKSAGTSWQSKDTNVYKRDIEDFIKGFITFEDNSSIIIRASDILNTVEYGTYVEISGEKAGYRLDKNGLKIYEITSDMCMQEITPLINSSDIFETEVNHFINCCEKKEECICKPYEALRLMEIIDAIYKSAETGEIIKFD